MIKVRVRHDQIGMVFNDGKFKNFVAEDRYWINPLGRKTIQRN